MNLVIDIGNSSVKTAVFKNTELLASKLFYSFETDDIKGLFEQYPEITKGIVSVVGKSNYTLEQYLGDHLDYLIMLETETPLPIENLYTTKETLGKDRIAGVAGANFLFPETNILVIDAGTAITYDFINSGAQYVGGSISPGMKMRFRALHEFTDKLPFLSPNDNFKVPSTDTAGAIISGIQSGIIKEVDGFIHEFNKQFPNLRVILTGGDAIFFEKKLKSSIFVDLNLILKGLNIILNFNAEIH